MACVTLLTQAMLLDIDGTLVDSNDKHADCWVEAFAHFGKKVDRQIVRGQIGKGGELWKRKYMRSVEPFAGAVAAMRAIHARGIRIVLAVRVRRPRRDDEGARSNR